jgi:hypothetical protein
MKTRMLAVLTVSALAAAACGSAGAGDGGNSLNSSGEVASLTEDGSGADTEASSDDVDTEAQLLAFAECIRDQGFEIDDPSIDADGNVVLPRPTSSSDAPGPPEGFLEARDTCAAHLEGVTLGFQGGDQTELQDELLEFAACMRDNGFDLPDPDFAEAGGRGLLREIDQNDPAYESAFANCGDILGGRGGGRDGG